VGAAARTEDDAGAGGELAQLVQALATDGDAAGVAAARFSKGDKARPPPAVMRPPGAHALAPAAAVAERRTAGCCDSCAVSAVLDGGVRRAHAGAGPRARTDVSVHADRSQPSPTRSGGVQGSWGQEREVCLAPPGPQVKVVEGDLKELLGSVRAVLDDGRVEVMPSMQGLDEVLAFEPGQLAKFFQARPNPNPNPARQALPGARAAPAAPRGARCSMRGPQCAASRPATGHAGLVCPQGRHA